MAGTLQDYNRAFIVGSPTYGKATAQVILPLDTIIDLNEDFRNKTTHSYLKLTINKLYRINGNSAQATGVIPDILLEDLLEADPHREINEAYAIPGFRISANKYYKPNPLIPLAALKAYAKSKTDSSDYFKAIRQFIAASKQQQAKDIPLLWTEAATEIKKHKAAIKYDPAFNSTKASFSVSNHESEEVRLKKDPVLNELYNILKQRSIKDPYIHDQGNEQYKSKRTRTVAQCPDPLSR